MASRRLHGQIHGRIQGAKRRGGWDRARSLLARNLRWYARRLGMSGAEYRGLIPGNPVRFRRAATIPLAWMVGGSRRDVPECAA